MYKRDTIAAIATGAAAGAIGIVRVSGPSVRQIASRVFQRARPGTWRSHRLYRGTVVDGTGAAIDDGLAVLFLSPRSYTGEDMLELHCHGSLTVLERVLEAVLAAGARGAEPGEFTRRAFLNGKLDLAQAEAIADLIAARSREMVQVAAAQLRGSLSNCVREIRDLVLEALALLEAEIDFPDEGDVVIHHSRVQASLAAAVSRMSRMLSTYRAGTALREGVSVALIGPPNAGKSSLFNVLVGSDRAIVSPVPGTTRDVVEGHGTLDGIPARFLDTAGWRETSDQIERLGLARAEEAASEADMVFLVVDASQPAEPLPPVPAGIPAVLVLNKCDLPVKWAPADASVTTDLPTVRVSAHQVQGIDELRHAAAGLIRGGQNIPTGPLLTRSRHRDALRQALEAVKRGAAALESGVPPEAVAVELGEAADHLAAITGGAHAEEILDRIFAEFCIGK